MSDTLALLKRYGSAMEGLRPGQLEELNALLDEKIEFKDPFNHHHSRAEMIEIFKRMHEKLPGARFRVLDCAVLTNDPQSGVLVWEMYDATPKNTKSLFFEGTSLVSFDAQGLVTRHIDHWDAGSQFYERFPIVGTLIRIIKKRV